MGTCWNCGKDVFLKEKETRCDNCKKIVRYWCNSCAKPFDVEDKDTNKKVKECKWCWNYNCKYCNTCTPDCSRFEHSKKIKEFLNGFIPIDKWNEINGAIDKIVAYFEEIKMGKAKTTCAFGVPKTYAKQNIKSILARMDGFRVRDDIDQEAFESRHEEILDKDIGEELTINNSRGAGSYGQEYRDVFNLCVCLGKLQYERKNFKNDEGKEIEYDSWTRIEQNECPFLDTENLVVKVCKKCQKVYPRNETYCPDCIYPKGGKKHAKGTSVQLDEKLSNNPTCKNLGAFKKRGENGEGES